MEELPITLQGAHTLVLGNGRIGSLLAAKLAALGAHVTVSARSPRDFARIEAAGHSSLHTRFLAGHLTGFDLVINTVPARVLGAAELAELPERCLLLDLASKPGGADGQKRRVRPAFSRAKKKASGCAGGFLRLSKNCVFEQPSIETTLSIEYSGVCVRPYGRTCRRFV